MKLDGRQVVFLSRWRRKAAVQNEITKKWRQKRPGEPGWGLALLARGQRAYEYAERSMERRRIKLEKQGVKDCLLPAQGSERKRLLFEAYVKLDMREEDRDDKRLWLSDATITELREDIWRYNNPLGNKKPRRNGA